MTAVLSTCNNPLPQLMGTNQQPPNLRRRPIPPFPLPKKLGSDRLLLVSKALNETPTYKSLSPQLIKQRDSLKPSNHERSGSEEQRRKRKVGFRAVDKVHVYEKEYDETDHDDMWFTASEFDHIFQRDDEDYTICYSSMAHTKQILQLWGMCSRDTIDESKKDVAVDALFRDPPHPHARGLENRIITGIRNHRQKAVQSFLQQQQQQQQQLQGADTAGTTTICPRYLKFSQTAQRFSQALAEGDARIAQIIKDEPWVDDVEDEEVEWCYY